MRQERTVQASIFNLFADHEIGRELKAMSQWLDEHRELLGSVADDLRRHGVKETGREGLPAEYHLDPLDPRGILTYWDYGPDLPQAMATPGLEIRMIAGPKGRDGRIVWEARRLD